MQPNTNPIFYHGTTKKIIVAFASLFDNVRYVNDAGITIKVPISFSMKTKFLESIKNRENLSVKGEQITLPRFGFEIQSINYAPERANDPLSTIKARSNQGKHMIGAVPYDFNFELFFATVKFEDSLKIAEQILPYFTPAVNISVKDAPEYFDNRDIQVVLNSCSFDIPYEGDFMDRRSVTWTMQFTMKAWLYGHDRVKRVIEDLNIETNGKKLDDVFFKVMGDV